MKMHEKKLNYLIILIKYCTRFEFDQFRHLHFAILMQASHLPLSSLQLYHFLEYLQTFKAK